MVTTSRSYQVSANSVTIFAHVLAIAVTILALVWIPHFQRQSIDFKSDSKWMILNTSFFFSFHLLQVHVLLTIIGLVLIGEALLLEILGVYSAFKFNHDFNVEEMLTSYSWLGIITICLFAFLTYCFPKAENLTRAMLLPWHGFVGMVIFLLAICTDETRFVEIFISLALERN
ncbi:hypothetical protein RGQ29_014820 [Quercus rubra]|uniref:Cytochrome b561 domain-containing protein n=1 Tax=Quercus rubra TaxID=3512 RepID=A0AAN7J3K7_QUERU|nr:hypothetical protein RGQ29_014820 [Quercus rubra]